MNHRLALAFAGAVLVACTAKEQQPNDSATMAAAATPNVVTITAKDFAFEAPDTIPAGVTTFRLVNQGPNLHHAQLIRLDQGKTLKDFLDGMKAMKPGEAPPAWAAFVGGPNPPDAGGEATVTQTLEPGNYAMVCFVDLPDHVMHVMKGMARAFVVVPSTTMAAEPTSDVTMQLADYTFTLSTPLTSGKHTIRIDNTGPQPHEVWIAKIDSGKTLDDLVKFAQTYKGDNPATGLGGVASIPPSAHAFVDVNLTPGTYALMCFVPDAKDGKPHFMHGMATQFKVG